MIRLGSHQVQNEPSDHVAILGTNTMSNNRPNGETRGMAKMFLFRP